MKQKTKKVNQTNVATRRIIEFLTFEYGAFVWRNNVLPIPLVGGGFRPGSKKGVPDILGILPCNGRFIGVEVKRGRDRLRPEQKGFHIQATNLGALMIVAKGKTADEIFDDFLKKFNKLIRKYE